MEDATIESPAAASPAEKTRRLTRHGTAFALSLAALYTAVFSFVSILKYRDDLYDDFDLAIFVQALNGILRGTLFGSIRGMNWLGDHSSLILFLLAPLFALFRHPITLLVIQSAALGLGALPIFWLARRELQDSRAALACAALYLFHPALGYVNLYEFHPEALCVPLLLFALLAKAAATEARIEEYRDKFAHPYIAAGRGYLDDIIDPRDTRPALIAALETLQTKRDKNPPKKHGNIPL